MAGFHTCGLPFRNVIYRHQPREQTGPPKIYARIARANFRPRSSRSSIAPGTRPKISQLPLSGGMAAALHWGFFRNIILPFLFDEKKRRNIGRKLFARSSDAGCAFFPANASLAPAQGENPLPAPADQLDDKLLLPAPPTTAIRRGFLFFDLALRNNINTASATAPLRLLTNRFLPGVRGLRLVLEAGKAWLLRTKLRPWPEGNRSPGGRLRPRPQPCASFAHPFPLPPFIHEERWPRASIQQKTSLHPPIQGGTSKRKNDHVFARPGPPPPSTTTSSWHYSLDRQRTTHFAQRREIRKFGESRTGISRRYFSTKQQPEQPARCVFLS